MMKYVQQFKDVFEDTRSILEPAGALAVAGVKSYIKKNMWTQKHLLRPLLVQI